MASLRPNALLLTLLATLPVMGQAAESPVISTVTSRLSNLQIELIDLAPNDGIAPSLTFDGGVAWDTGTASPGQLLYSNALLPSSTLTHTSADGNTVVTASPTGIEIKSQLTYDALKNGASETSYNGYFGINGAVDTGRGVSLLNFTNPEFGPSFTLSPHTLAIVHATLSAAWSLDGQAIASQIDPKYTTWSVTLSSNPGADLSLVKYTDLLDASGSVRGSTFEGGGANFTLSAYSSTDSFSVTDTPLHSDQSSQNVAFNFVNASDENVTGVAQMAVGNPITYTLSGWGIDPGSVVIGVPEPGTYALMGLGLVGIALVRRRRG